MTEQPPPPSPPLDPTARQILDELLARPVETLEEKPPEDSKEEDFKKEVLALASAAIDRLGSDSPASLMASDPMLLRHFSEVFVARDPLCEKLAEVAGDEPATSKVLHQIAIAAREKAVADRFIRRGGLEAVITLMKDNKASRKIQKNGGRAIWDLSSRSDSVAGRDGEIEVLLGALTQFKDDMGVQVQAIGALANICVPEGTSERVVEAGGLPKIIGGMRKWITESDMLRAGCLALNNIATEALQDTVIAAGGVSLLVDAMIANPDNGDIQGFAAEALANLVINRPNIERHSEIIMTTIAALAIHGKSHQGAAQHALRVLRNLAVSAKFQMEIADNGGLEAMIATFFDFEEENVRMHSGAALWNVCCDPRNRLPAVEKGCIDGILTVLRSKITEHELLLTTCGALWTVLSLEGIFQKYCSPEVLEVVSKALEAYPEPKPTCLLHLSDALARREHPGIVDARAHSLCSKVAVPRCKPVCGAERQRYCMRDPTCSAVQKFFSCHTCDGQSSNRRYCQTCATSCHQGHEIGEPQFFPSSCDCLRLVCKQTTKPLV